MQNPIKKWNLVSNDEYQQALARFFWKKRLYYERRSKEWNFRRTELKSRGIRKGPDLKLLTQLLASAYWNEKQLGPATSKSKVSDLFEDKPYGIICRISPEEAYQIYLLSEIIELNFFYLSKEKRYIKNFRGHITFCLLALLFKISKTVNAAWGRSEFTAFRERELTEHRRVWHKLVKASIDRIRREFSQTAKRYRTKTGNELNYNNFFKN